VGDLHVPVPSDGALFGTRTDALTLIGANPGLGISDPGPVNVVVIDSGFDLGCVPAGQFGGGWQPLPGGLDLPTPMPPGMTRGPEGLHGAMIVENVLALAPKAMIFDVPLIPPPKIYDVPTFLHLAEAIYQALLVQIPFYSSYFPGPWVLVNAWSVYDRRSELPKLGQYTENKGYFGPPHAFIKLIQQIAGAHYDMVFAAGNCGEYCPDGRCGPDDYGPGRSIWGANAHAGVITPGAVRVDATWLGFSSEGPGPTPHLAAAKPDLCAPTQFLGPSGLYPFSTGTSASAAVTAGVVAALRTKWDQTKVPPVILKLVLNYSATQPLGIGWNPWFGNGILNAAAAFNTLHAAYP
jgi:hypothetical protein